MFRRAIQFLARYQRAFLYIYVTAAFGFSLLLIQHNANDQRERERIINASAQHRECLQAQQGRDTVRNVIIVATSPQVGQTRLDFTKVPGFANLDEAQKQYLINLTPLIAPPSAPPTTTLGAIPPEDPNNALQKSLLAQAPPITC